MEALLEKIVGLLEAAGGSMTWDALLQELDFKEQGRMMNAVRLGKANGVLKRELSFNPETGLSPLTVSLIPAETEG